MNKSIVPLLIGSLASYGTAASKWQRQEKLAIRKVEAVTKNPAAWKRVEIRVDLAGTYQTPFDPKEIAVDALVAGPLGKMTTVPAFFYQPFEHADQVVNNRRREALKPAGDPDWRVRLMPEQAGAYSVRIRAKDRSGVVTSAPMAFTVKPGSGHGYIRVSKKDPHYFEFQDGTPYFAIGENIAGGNLATYQTHFPKLADASANFCRLWIGGTDFGLEYGQMGEYRLDRAYHLDEVMELSERYGIYQKMCLDWVRHISPRGEPRKLFDPEDNAYSVSNGGPCHDMKEFFILPEARRLYKARMRYTVARWGYSPNVMAWEQWNEINLMDDDVSTEDVILPWNAEMNGYLKQIDPWRHLTTNSLGSGGVWPMMWQMKENDFAQVHGYYHPLPGGVRHEERKDMAGFAISLIDKISRFGKPALWAEFGIVREEPELLAISEKDTEGVHMHNGAWGAFAAGAAGPAHFWYSNVFDRLNLYAHLKAISSFVKGIDWTGEGFQKAEIEMNRDGESERLRVVGLHGKTLTFLWLQNKDHTWWNVVNKLPCLPIENARFKVTMWQPGNYRIEFWDTYEGKMTQSRTMEASKWGGVLTIPIDRLERDMALKIYRGGGAGLRPSDAGRRP